MAEEANSKVQVRVSEDKEGGVYTNAISVHVNPNEVTIDLGYVLPNSNPTTIKVMERVNMSHKTAESFMNVLSNAMLDWRNRSKEQDK